MQTQTQRAQDYWTATAMAIQITRPPVTIYGEDGSMYKGHVNEHGEKHGLGTLKTEIYITGVVGDDNSHLMKWTEFSGNWKNGVMHGQGVMRRMCGNGVVIKTIYDGLWDNGVPAPVMPAQTSTMNDDPDDDNESDTVYDDAYYDYVSDLPRRGDYDHSEEAS
jgi:hypothetical protein